VSNANPNYYEKYYFYDHKQSEEYYKRDADADVIKKQVLR
jgi:hypothetical protein